MWMPPLLPFVHLMTNMLLGSHCRFVAVNWAAVSILGHFLCEYMCPRPFLRSRISQNHPYTVPILFHSYFYISFFGLYLPVVIGTCHCSEETEYSKGFDISTNYPGMGTCHTGRRYCQS